MTYEEWIDGFLRDQVYINEIRIWERIANIFSEYCLKFRVKKIKKRKEVFRNIMRGFMFGIDEKTLKNDFSENGMKFLLDSWTSDEPVSK